MRNFHVSTGVLSLLAFSLICVAQEPQQTGTEPATAPPVSPPAIPVMPGEVNFESSVGNVLFPHAVHLKFGCVACHHQIHAEALDTPHPDYLSSSKIHCETCHDSDTETLGQYYKCSNCHHSEPENIADETLSAKVVVHQSCWKCHKSGTGVEASRGCEDCHVKEEKQPEAPNG